jgi:hypothetical protein
MALNTSPMFRTMYPDKQRSALTGLLLDSEESSPSAHSPSPSLPSSPAMPDWRAGAAGSPSRGQLLNQPQRAQTQYAQTPPPATAPESVWRSPALDNVYNYRQTPNSSVTAGLLDGPQGSVAANLGDAPATPLPLPSVAAMPPNAEDDRAPPLPQIEFVGQGGNASLPPQRPMPVLDPLVYSPLQPIRRYEVI